MMASSSLLVVLGLLLFDGATTGALTTPLLLDAGKSHPAWTLAILGGLSSALGSVIQLKLLQWVLEARHPWLARWTPSRDKLEEALKRYRSASFVGVMLMRATPLPDLPVKLVAAAGRYPIFLYGTAVWLGALPYYFLLARLGSSLRIPTWALAAAAGALLLFALIDRLRSRKPARSS